MAMKKTWRPKWRVGDRLRVIYAPRGSKFFYDDVVEVVERSVRERAKDPRQNRYHVRTLHRSFGQQVSGWLYEDDLEAL